VICGREEGAPPPVDLAAERRNGEFVLTLIRAGRLTAVHDISDGGLAVALAEMAVAGRLGAAGEPIESGAHGFLFGEDQGRYVVTARAAEAAAIIDEARAAGVAVQRLGATGGDALTLPGEAPILVADLTAAFESWFPAFMAGPRREIS
jgi:phosphoribosylformylglycinamidine synthase subunit PurL